MQKMQFLCRFCNTSAEMTGGLEGDIRQIGIFVWRLARLMSLKWHERGGSLGQGHRLPIGGVVVADVGE
jgi:hypothetical protein